MKKIILIFFAVMLSFRFTATADEGMWLPLLVERLNYVDMKKMGLNLTPEEIYSINNSSIKDAIVIFGGGCTGEIISSQGLILTNHHCGYGNIQSHSTVEHDYLTNGFWAMNKKEELPNEGLQVRFLVRIEDVTKDILKNVNPDMTEPERDKAVNKAISKIKKNATEGNNYEAKVGEFFDGNEYYLFIYEVYNDVRLVGAPPSSIGKYGADTDNWMWPRHTGDFSLFRVYADKDGNPAEYSEDNVPLNPKHHLPVSLKGYKKNDFAFIMGFPGSTDRFLSSYGIAAALDIKNPTIVNIREKKLEIMRHFMDREDAVRIQYASKYARTANYWKYFIGQSKGLKRLKVEEKKKKIEETFLKWAKSSKALQGEYGEAVNLIREAYLGLNKYETAKWYFFEAVYRGPEVVAFSRNFEHLAKALEAEEPNQEKIERIKKFLLEKTDKFFKDYHAPVDQMMMAEMTRMFIQNVPADQQADIFITIKKKYKGNYEKFAADVFKKSVFVDKAKVMELIEEPSAKTIRKDPVFVFMKSTFAKYFENLEASNEYANKLQKGRRIFIRGLRKMEPGKNYYPDANSTMRLTYGKVIDYYPADAVHYKFFTTLKGVMDKEDPKNWEFVVHPKLKELFEARDYGRYADNGIMKVCFLTDNDITGGNSGSPVMNGDGHLIGLAFDGNWEAMSGDIVFEPELQRTINVDIRYVLFIIDKFAGAGHLVNEMTIIEDKAVVAPSDKGFPMKPKAGQGKGKTNDE